MYACLAPSRRLNVLMLAALMHYVNACPCGCLEHHALYQTLVAATGGQAHKHDSHGHLPHTHTSHVRAPHAGTDVTDNLHQHLESYHCHGPTTVVFSASRCQARTAPLELSLTQLSVTTAPIVPLVDASSTAEVLARGAGSRALQLRAHAEVMLI